MDPETPAGLFRQKKFESLKSLFGIDVISSNVEIFQFSAHSNRQELLQMVKQMNPSKVVLTHGDGKAVNWFKNNINNILPDCQSIIPQKSVHIEITI